jgi:hypothetical protein
MNQVKVGGKTGTAQVAKGTQITDTSVFASFAGLPGQKPQYVSIIIVPDAGYGAAVAGPATRLLWDGMYGLEGKPNVLPKGLLDKLPSFSADGNMVTKAPLIASAAPTPTTTGSVTPGVTTTQGTQPGTTSGTTAGAPAAATGGATATALPPLLPTAGQSPPARIVAFGSSGRSPPTTATAR